MVFFAVLYHAKYISMGYFLFVEITLVLALMALLLPRGNGGEMPVLNVSIPLWILPAIVYLVGQIEMALLRHTEVFYLMTLAAALIITAISAERPVKKIAVAVTIVGASIALLFTVYASTFGNDTWRDAIWAKQILERGSTTETTIRHSAYQLPMVPVLYAILSLVSGSETVWSSVVLGFLYLIYLPIITFLVARRFTGVVSYEAPFLLLMTPLVVIWSVCYIPQIYAISILLGAISTQMPLLLQLALLSAVVFSHPIVAVFAVLALLILAIHTRDKMAAKLLLALLSIFSIILIVFSDLRIYFINNLGIMWNRFQDLFHNGVSISVSSLQSAPPKDVAFGYLSLSVIAVAVLLAFLHGGLSVKISVTLLSLPLIIAFIGLLTPLKDIFDFPRYLGLPAVVLLAMLAPHGFSILKAKRNGSLFAVFLMFVAITSFVYTGVFMPENPFTATPSVYSVYGLVSWEEATHIPILLQLLDGGKYITDWRYGLSIAYEYTWISGKWNYWVFEDIYVYNAGAYGLIVDQSLLERAKLYLIYRRNAEEMPNVYNEDIKLLLNSSQILYNSDILILK